MSQVAVDYRPMWASLGLDLEKHDALLSVLGAAYADIFLSQKNRPAGMAYFDFVMSEVHGLRIKELMDARAQGRIVVGSYCVFVPEELILAVDGVSVGLCAGAEFGFDQAEKYLPVNTCSLIKSAFGFTLERVCPYIAASDLIVGENTCDGKKKAYEVLKDLLGKLYIMDMPQQKSDQGRALLKAEYHRFTTELEKKAGRSVTVESLRKAIATVNAKRAAMHRLASLRSHDPSPVSGMDALLMNQVYFYDDPGRFTASINAICDELAIRIKEKQGVAAEKTPRILISGCPMAVPNWKIPMLIERAGAVIVGEESCVGERGTQNLTSVEGATVAELIDSLVDRYMKIDCAIFTPNPGRTEHAESMIQDYRADGVIHYSLQFCTPYQMESKQFEHQMKHHQIPVLSIDTDYSTSDFEQLRTRIQAFIEHIAE